METSYSSSSLASQDVCRSRSYANNGEKATWESKNNYLSALHSVRKLPLKPMKKASISPMPPSRPRVYKVDPIDFRDLVQKLTGAPQPKDPKPKPATSPTAVPQAKRPVPLKCRDFSPEAVNGRGANALENTVTIDSLLFDLSPLLSPGSLSRW